VASPARQSLIRLDRIASVEIVLHHATKASAREIDILALRDSRATVAVSKIVRNPASWPGSPSP
jgi:hypothetical protein